MRNKQGQGVGIGLVGRMVTSGSDLYTINYICGLCGYKLKHAMSNTTHSKQRRNAKVGRKGGEAYEFESKDPHVDRVRHALDILKDQPHACGRQAHPWES